MISYNLIFLRSHLENAILLVVGKIPRNYAENFFLVVHGNDLELILIICLNDLDNLGWVTKLCVHLLHCLAINLLNEEVHLQPKGALQLFLVRNKETVFEVLATVHNHKIAKVNFSTNDVGAAIFQV